MNSKLKKLMATSLAAVSVFACAFGASANSTVKSTVNVPSTDDHTYGVYQIMTGDSDGDSLTNVKWGTNAVKTAGTYVTHEDLTAIESLKDLSSDSEKLKGTDTVAGLASYVDLTSTPVATASKSSPAEVEEGYYLFKDNNTVTGSDTYTLYIAKVANGSSITISRKAATSTPTVEKTVKEGDTYAKGADASQSDTIEYQVVATLPDNLDAYSLYKYTLTDTPDEGLTLNKDSVKVMMDSTDVTDKFTVSVDGTSLVIACDDILTISGVSATSKFTFTYTGSLNDKAVTGTTGNENGAVLTYSNNPNDTTSTNSSSSTEDTAKTYTYRLVINEQDENGDALEGVGLTLSKKNASGEYEVVGSEVTGVTTFTWEKLDAGEYKLSETTTPAGYKTMDDKEFTITSTISDEGELTALASTLEGATVTLSTGTIEASIINGTKTSLPVTGAMGIIGIAVAAAGAFGTALVLKKKEDQ